MIRMWCWKHVFLLMHWRLRQRKSQYLASWGLKFPFIFIETHRHHIDNGGKCLHSKLLCNEDFFNPQLLGNENVYILHHVTSFYIPSNLGNLLFGRTFSQKSPFFRRLSLWHLWDRCYHWWLRTAWETVWDLGSKMIFEPRKNPLSLSTILFV